MGDLQQNRPVVGTSFIRNIDSAKTRLLPIHEFTAIRKYCKKNHTMKNFSHSFSNGNKLGVKNMKAIFVFFDCTGRARMMSLMITRAAISSSVYTLAGSGGGRELQASDGTR